jgi:hypothetical protein
MPELNAEATRIVEAARISSKMPTLKYDEESALLTERQRFQLCPEPEEPSFRRDAR